MAFETDCGSSPVLEGFHAASTMRHHRCKVLLASRRGPPQQCHADWSFPAENAGCGTSNPKSEIRNPKSKNAT